MLSAEGAVNCAKTSFPVFKATSAQMRSPRHFAASAAQIETR
jgi:hypothetical protein